MCLCSVARNQLRRKLYRTCGAQSAEIWRKSNAKIFQAIQGVGKIFEIEEAQHGAVFHQNKLAEVLVDATWSEELFVGHLGRNDAHLFGGQQSHDSEEQNTVHRSGLKTRCSGLIAEHERCALHCSVLFLFIRYESVFLS